MSPFLCCKAACRPYRARGWKSHWSLVPPMPLCKENSAGNWRLVGELFFFAYFLPCHVPYYSIGERHSSSQLQVERTLHQIFCIILVPHVIQQHHCHCWRLSTALLQKPTELPGYASNSLVHLLSPCKAEWSCIPCLENRNHYVITKSLTGNAPYT